MNIIYIYVNNCLYNIPLLDIKISIKLIFLIICYVKDFLF